METMATTKMRTRMGKNDVVHTHACAGATNSQKKTRERRRSHRSCRSRHHSTCNRSRRDGCSHSRSSSHSTPLQCSNRVLVPVVARCRFDSHDHHPRNRLALETRAMMTMTMTMTMMMMMRNREDARARRQWWGAGSMNAIGDERFGFGCDCDRGLG